MVVLAAGVAAAMLPFARAAIAAAASLVIVALVAAQVIAWSGSLRATAPSAYERALKRPNELPERPPDLEELERALGWGSYSRRDFDHRVKPVLERLVSYKLMSAGGAEAHRPAGEGLLEPERDASGTARGSQEPWIDTPALARLLDRIEAL